MEFNEKLQNLRKQKGITQEEAAKALFVSRTAISKWESGRGYPSIDSLKTIADFFGITIDNLLSSDELITIAKESGKQHYNRLKDLVFGLLDISVAILFFLPFFAQKGLNEIIDVSLLSLNGITLYLKVSYFIFVFITIICGILTLALQNFTFPFWLKNKSKISLFLTVLGVLLFVVSLQPYVAVLLFIFLIIKALMLKNTL